MQNGRWKMARGLGVPGIAVAVLALTGTSSAGQQVATQAVSATVSFAPRTALTVSARTLHFVVTDANTPATASVDFSAAARTSTDGAVTLLVEAGGVIGLPPAVALEIVSGPAGAALGTVLPQQSVVSGRWTGSGARAGRVTFQLRAQPGTYEIPIAFLLQLS